MTEPDNLLLAKYNLELNSLDFDNATRRNRSVFKWIKI